MAKDPTYGIMHHPSGVYMQPGQQFLRYGVGQPPKGPTGQSQQGPPQMIHHPMGQEQIIATDQWKMNRRIQQQQQQQQQAKEDIKNAVSHGRSTPDDRNIIRISQSPSPRAKTSYEPVSPPEQTHYYQKPVVTINERKMTSGGPPPEGQPGAESNVVLKFFNSKIAEAMRSDDLNDHPNDGNKEDGVHMVKSFERPRSGNGIPDNDNDKSAGGKRESPYNIGQSVRQPSHQAFMYPYSALTLSTGVNSPIISPKAASELIDANRQQSTAPAPPLHMESRQVLSEQYDALSDED